MACRTRREQAELVRIVRRPDGSVVLDEDRLEGRGAYLCPDASCWALALRRAALQRALRVTLPDELSERLERGLESVGLAVAGRLASQAMLGGPHGT